MPLPVDFIHDLIWDDIPTDVQHMASRCLLDLTATLVVGRDTEVSRITYNAAAEIFGGDQSTLLLDGRRVSAPGAALAHAMTIDAMDIHDGHRLTKGHAGVNVFPAALAMGELCDWDGENLRTALVLGYEIALRAGIALHQTSCDYHTSGSWGALGAAAIAARATGLSIEQTRHALGIAEYYGPRSQMMRAIDHPTMLKDGSGWGSMTGLTAAHLAASGFTGAPALTMEDSTVKELWTDLGETWRIGELYFKPFACCRWAQPAIEGVLDLVAAHQVEVANIAQIQVHTFAAATRLACARPLDTEQAQYSLPYPVAAALFHQHLDPQQVLPPTIHDENILQLADRVVMQIDAELEQEFPTRALARVVLRTKDGQEFSSGIKEARGDPHNPLSDAELNDKFQRLTIPMIGQERVDALQNACWQTDPLPDVKTFLGLLKHPAQFIRS